MTPITVVEDIQKELEEARKYNYSEFVVKQDLIYIIEKFENYIMEYAYNIAKEDVKSAWERSHPDPYNYYIDEDSEDEED